MAAVIAHAFVEVLPDVSRFSQRLTKDLRKATSAFKKISVGVSVGSLKRVIQEVTKMNEAVRAAILGFTILAGKAALLGGAAVLNSVAELSGALLILPAAAVAAGVAMGALKVGLFGVDDALKAFLKGDMEKFNEKLKELSPNAQKTLGVLKQFAPALKEFRNAVQDALFDKLEVTAKALGTQLLPRIRFEFIQIAHEANQAIKQVAGFALNPKTLRDTDTIFLNISKAVKTLVGAFVPLIQAFRDISVVGSHFLPGVAAQLTVAAQAFAQFIANARSSGHLSDIIGKGLSDLTQVFKIIFNLFGALHTVFKIMDDAGIGVIDTLSKVSAGINSFVKSVEGQAIIRQFFVSAREAVEALLPVIGTLAKVFVQDVAPVLVSFAKILGPAITTIIEAIGEAFKIAQPGLEVFAHGMSDFLISLAPLLPVIGELFGTLAKIMGKILSDIGPQLSDILIQIGETLVKFFADPEVQKMMQDLAQAFIDLVKAAVPLLKPLLQLVKIALPFLVDILRIIEPILQPFTEMLSELIPIFKLLFGVTIILLVPLAGLTIGIIRLVSAFATLGGVIINAVGNAIIEAKSLFDAWFEAFGGAEKTTRNFVDSAQNQLVDRLPNTALRPAGQAATDFFAAMKSNFDAAAQAVNDSVTKIGSVLNPMTQSLGKAGSAAGSAYRTSVIGELGATIDEVERFKANMLFELFGIVEPAGRAGAAAGFKFSDGLRAQLGIAVSNAQSIVSNIGGILFSGGGSAGAAGSALGDAFAAGMLRKIADIRRAALALMNAASSVFPHSPAEIGPFSGRGWTPFRGAKLAEGFALGIDQGQETVRRASLALAQSATSGFGSPTTISPQLFRSATAAGGDQLKRAKVEQAETPIINTNVHVFVDGAQLRVMSAKVVSERDRSVQRNLSAGIGGAR